MTQNSTVGMIRLILLFVLFGLSFGGFTFYASVVVPIGTDVLDATTQGFITQKVTRYINIINAATIAVFVWYGGTQSNSASTKRWFWGSLFVYVLCTAALFLLHPLLSSKLDVVTLDVKNPDGFYQLHATYLWTSTIHWLATLVMIGTVCRSIVASSDEKSLDRSPI